MRGKYFLKLLIISVTASLPFPFTLSPTFSVIESTIFDIVSFSIAVAPTAFASPITEDPNPAIFLPIAFPFALVYSAVSLSTILSTLLRTLSGI